MYSILLNFNFCVKIHIMIIRSWFLTTVCSRVSCMTRPELLREEEACENSYTQLASAQKEEGVGREREREGGCVRMRVWEKDRQRERASLLAVGVYFSMCVCFRLCLLHNGDVLQVNERLHRRKTVTMTDEEAIEGLMRLLPYLAFNLQCNCFVFIFECNLLLLFISFSGNVNYCILNKYSYLSWHFLLFCLLSV